MIDLCSFIVSAFSLIFIMPFAATHIIVTTSLLASLQAKMGLNGFDMKYFAFFAAIGSLLPDIDIPLGWLFRSLGLVIDHGTVTHTPFFAFIFLFASLIFGYSIHKNLSSIFKIFFFGILIHILLDFTLGGGAKEGIAWFYPLNDSTYKLHLLFLLPFDSVFEALDAIVLLVWFYLKSPKLHNKS